MQNQSANAMKFFVVGDPHFREGCVREMELFTDEVLRIVAEHSSEIEFVVVLGDVMDRHGILHQKPFHQSCKFLIDLAALKKTYCLIGNHDFDIPSKYLPENHPYKIMVWNKVENLVIVEKPMVVDTMFLCPYVPPGDFPRAIFETLSLPMDTELTPWDALQRSGVGLVFAHQEFRGCQMGRLKSETGDIWGEGEFGSSPFVVSGHIHDYQMVGENILYTGTPIQVNYGEGAKRGVCIMDMEFDLNTGLPTNRSEEWFEIRVPKKLVRGVPLEKLDAWVRDRFDQLMIRYSMDRTNFKPQKKRGKQTRQEEGFETIYDLHSRKDTMTELTGKIHEDRFLDKVRLHVFAFGEKIPVAKIIIGKLKDIPMGLQGVFLQESDRPDLGDLGGTKALEGKTWLEILQTRVSELETESETKCGGVREMLSELLRELTQSENP